MRKAARDSDKIMNVIPFNINPNATATAPAPAPAGDKDKPRRPLSEPRRPLSAYNLFFRFKRQKILEACKGKEGDIDRETVESIVSCTPGLENVSHDAVPELDEDELGKFRSDRIRAELEDKLTPKEAGEVKARSHRKTQFKHGLSFLEMTKIISSSWKECDDISKKIFETLAEDGRNIRQQLLEDYTKAQGEKSNSPSSGGNNQAMLAKSFDNVRPNAIHKPAAAFKKKAASQAAEREDEEFITEGHGHGANMNSNQEAIDYMKRIYGQRPPQPTLSAATAAAAFASMNQNQTNPASTAAGLARPLETTYSVEQSLLNPLKNNPYLPPSYQESLFLSAHASGRARNPFSTTSAADKLKMVQLEAANESMKKMLEKLVTVNADLEGQNTNLTQLVGQLTAENSSLKRSIALGQLTTKAPSSLMTRNIGAVTPSAPIHYDALSQGLGFPPGPTERSKSEETLPQQKNKKRRRVLADPWSRR